MEPSRSSKSSPEQGKGKPRRSKRTAALAKQQKDEVVKRIPQLELRQAFSDERAEHDATKAIVSRMRLEHKDLVKRLDEAETAVAMAESRAWESEKKIIKLQKSLSESRMGAQRNETWMELIAEENQQLEEANVRMVARTAVREGEHNREIELMEEQARNLEQSLSIVYKDVEGYGVRFQKNSEDWAELVKYFDEYKSEVNDRVQDIRRLVPEYSNLVSNWEENSFISQELDMSPYSNQGRSRHQEHMIAEDSSSTEGTDNESSLGESWSIPSLSSNPTRLSGSRLSNLSFKSWNYVQERIGIGRPKPESSSIHDEPFSNGYIPPLNISRKRVELAPPPSDTISDVANEDNLDVEQDDPNRMAAASSYLDVHASIEATDCEVPQSASDTWVLNDEWTWSSFTVEQRQGKPIVMKSESKGIQTDDAPLLARPDNLAASSLQALVLAPKGRLGPGGKPRSLSVGDLPRILATEEATPFERMPGSWPREAISHADVNPISASEIADAVLQVFKASIENAIPVSIKLLHLLNPVHPNCIVYPVLMVLWMWQSYEQHVEWKRWERANERYFAQQLRNRYALQPGWVDSMGFGLSQWLAFDRSSFG